MTDVHDVIQLAADRDPDRVSPASARAYLRDAHRLGRQNMLPEQVAGCLNTYYALVAAITYVAAKDVLCLAGDAVRDQLDDEGRRTFAFCGWVLRRYPPATPDVPPHLDPRRQQRTPPQLPRKGNHGKRDTARRVSRSQREHRGEMFAAAKRQDLEPAAVAILRATGARPAEIEKGVLMQRVEDELYVTIHGAKVNQDRGTGQNWRMIALSLDSPETAYLAGFVPRDGDAHCVSCPRHRLYRATRRAAVAGLGRRLGKDVSPYVFRHMITTRWRKALSGRDELAGARGDRSTRSSEQYGGGSTGLGPKVWLVDCTYELRFEAPGNRPGPSVDNTPN